MNPALIASLAAGGLLAGRPQRVLITRLAVPADPPPARDRPGPSNPPAWPRRLPLALVAWPG